MRQYLYDGGALVAEYDANNAIQKRYVHGDQVDEPWVEYNGSAITARNYLHSDHQGSIIALSDSGGGVTAKFSYDGFGIPANNNSDTFGYTGQVYFKDLGLDYYKARFYSPKLGRFLQTDPIGYKDDMDLYAYVGNDFINKTDPSGEFGVAGVIYGAISGAAGGYISSGGTFREKLVGVVAGGLAGGAVGFVAPHTARFVGMAVAGAVASGLGQAAGSATNAAIDKGVSNVKSSDVKVSAIVTAAGALGAGVGSVVGKGVASFTAQPLIGNTLQAAGTPTVAGLTAGAVVEGSINGVAEKLVSPPSSTVAPTQLPPEKIKKP